MRGAAGGRLRLARAVARAVYAEAKALAGRFAVACWSDRAK